MKKLVVYFSGWNLDFPLGVLAEGSGTLVFEFSREARAYAFDLSPFHHPLTDLAPISRPTRSEQPLAGFLDDALPDGWGRLLVDRALLAKGHKPAEVTVLDRLAIVGNNAVGALRFEPADERVIGQRELDVMALAREVRHIQAGQPSAFLVELLKAGTRQGARPKAAVWLDRNTLAISTQPFHGAQPWLVKFPGNGEGVHAPAIEKVYSLLARDSGINVPDSLWLPLKAVASAGFAVERFDRRGQIRVPIQSFAALLDADFRRQQVDYEDLIRMVRQLTGDEREVVEFFRRCVFNVVFNNRDDHLKNFAAQLGQDRRWTLAPAFDLTFIEGPGGEHTSTVAGAGKHVTRGHLLKVAHAGGLKKPAAAAIVDQVVAAAPKFRRLAAKHDVPAEERERVEESIQQNAKECRT